MSKTWNPTWRKSEGDIFNPNFTNKLLNNGHPSTNSCHDYSGCSVRGSTRNGTLDRKDSGDIDSENYRVARNCRRHLVQRSPPSL